VIGPGGLQIRVYITNIVFPIGPVKVFNAAGYALIGIKAAQIDGNTIGVGTRVIEALHTAGLAKQVFRDAGVERVFNLIVFAGQNAEIGLVDDDMDKPRHGADRAIARQRNDLIGQIGLKAHRATMAATAAGFGGRAQFRIFPSI